jgi:putative glycosyltransferase (TIGR04372 family)
LSQIFLKGVGIKLIKYITSDFPSEEIKRGTKLVKFKFVSKWTLKKTISSINRLGHAFWAIPAILVIRIIRPWIVVRVGTFISHRIGHFIADSHYQVVLTKVGQIKSLDLWAIGDISNLAWYKIIKRQLNVRKVFGQIYFWNQFVPGGDKHQVLTLKNSRDISGIFTKNVTTVDFTDKENKTALNWLTNFGWNIGEPFICILNRDPQYLKNQLMSSRLNTKDFDFYDYHSYRNTSISDYQKSIIWLLDKGYWVLRMGKVAEERLPMSNPKLIDYPFLETKSDLLDVWLFAHCAGCISTGTGIDYLSWIQGIPSLILNSLPLGNSMTNIDSITVPKNLYWKSNKMELSLDEYLGSLYFKTLEYESNDIIIQDLSENQILQATREFTRRLESQQALDLDDNENQEIFLTKLRAQSYFVERHGFIHPKFKIGSYWLKSKGPSFFQ